MTARTEYAATFDPLPWQIAPWRDTSPVILLTGSAGGGKSRLAGTKVHGYMLKYPGATGLVVRKSRESMTNSTVIFLDRKVIAGHSQVRHVQTKSRWEYTNGSVLAYGGMYDDRQREQVRSIGQDGGLDIVWIEEANRLSEDDYNELLARMRGKAAPWCQIILSTNPDHPSHWINRRLIQGGEARVYYSQAGDNPHNPPSYIEALGKLTGVLGLRLREGRWVQAEGAVYDGWDEAVHVIDRVPLPADALDIDEAGIPRSWRRFRSVDFGFSHAFVCQWWAMDPDGRLYLYREIYMSQRTVRAHAEQITRLSAGEQIECTVADHDAEDRATLAENGIRTVGAIKEISPGIQAVMQRLKPGHDGRPRLYLLRNCTVETDWRLEEARRPTSTEQEIPGYVWPQSGDGRPVREVPVKENDDGCDALRYAVAFADRLERRPSQPARQSARVGTHLDRPGRTMAEQRDWLAKRRETGRESGGGSRRSVRSGAGH